MHLLKLMCIFQSIMISFQELMQFDKNAKPGVNVEPGAKVESGVTVKPDVKVEPGLQKVKKGRGASSISLSLGPAVTQTSGHSVGSETKVVKSQGVSRGSSGIEKTFKEQLRNRDIKTKMAKFVTPNLVKKKEKVELLNQLNFYKNKQLKNKNNGGSIKRSAVIKIKGLKHDIIEQEAKTNQNRPDTTQDNPNVLCQTRNRPNVIESGAIEQHMTKTNVTETNVSESDGIEPNVNETNAAGINVTKPTVAATNMLDLEPNVTESKQTETQSDKTKPSLNKKIFKCDKCNEYFAYLKRFSDHQAKGTCDASFSCCFCNVRLKDAKNLKKHVKKIHERPHFQCAECSKVFRTERAVTKHMQNFHLPNQCKLCKKLLKNANTRRSHFLQCKKMKNSAVGAEVGNKDTIDHSLTEASTSVNDSKANDHENVEEDTTKPEKDADPVSNVVKYSKECSLCKKVYHSRSGFHKHMKTHRLAEQKDPGNEVLIVDDEGNPIENIVIVDEEGTENNIILQFDNL